MNLSDSPPRGGALEDAAGLGQLSRRLGRLLFYGVALSAVLLSIGVLLVALSDPSATIRTPLSSHTLLAWGPALPGIVFILAGLVVLVATPVARVIASLRTFLVQGERDYGTLVAAVLVILGVSALVGWWL